MMKARDFSPPSDVLRGPYFGRVTVADRTGTRYTVTYDVAITIYSGEDVAEQVDLDFDEAYGCVGGAAVCWVVKAKPRPFTGRA